eukprot:SM000263S09820  [mRNA]  locus=s263:68785:77349:- [translate_table: standard]
MSSVTVVKFGQYRRIRHDVFVIGQGVPEEEEVDEFDEGALVHEATKRAAHFLAFVNSVPAGTGRLLTYKAPGELAKVGRIATSPDFRRQGVVRATMLAIHFGQYRRIRHDVFVIGQGVPEEEEVDEFDEGALVHEATKRAAHFLAFVNSVPAGTGRLLTYKAPGELAKVGRIATSPDFRRQGVVRATMLAIHNEAHQLAYAGRYLGAQLDACNFYLSLGYIFQSEEVFLDAGIKHHWMEMRL